MDGCNSTPRDVVISGASSKFTNGVLFQRTLRTTRSNASLVLFMDQVALDSMDKDSLQFTKQMNTQIIKIPSPPGKGVRTKNYFAYVFKEFLRENENEIDRVVFLDLFDSLFQEDPFNTKLPTDKLHLVDENVKNKNNLGTQLFANHTIKGFKFDNITGEMKTINSGYVGGPVLLVIAYFTEQLTLLTLSSGDDQGSINILYVTGDFERKGIKIAEDDYNGKIRHLSFYRPEEPFPRVSGHCNKSIIASAIHLYYYSDKWFFISVLQACPRITKNMNNYLTKFTKNIELYEEEIANLTAYNKSSSTMKS